MKTVKRVTILALVVFVLFFAFYKAEPISLEGTWDAQTIRLHGETLYPDTIARYFNICPKIEINNWSHTITVERIREGLRARFKLIKIHKNTYQVQLTSKDTTLNGLYDLEIDTTDTGPQSYTVGVRLASKDNYLYFKREVVIPPWKPPFPRKGQV